MLPLSSRLCRAKALRSGLTGDSGRHGTELNLTPAEVGGWETVWTASRLLSSQLLSLLSPSPPRPRTQRGGLTYWAILLRVRHVSLGAQNRPPACSEAEASLEFAATHRHSATPDEPNGGLIGEKKVWVAQAAASGTPRFLAWAVSDRKAAVSNLAKNEGAGDKFNQCRYAGVRPPSTFPSSILVRSPGISAPSKQDAASVLYLVL